VSHAEQTRSVTFGCKRGFLSLPVILTSLRRKEPLTRLATLATLSPKGEGRFPACFCAASLPWEEGGPLPALSPAGAGRAYARRRGSGEP
jgi:hypothetical protein